MKYKMMSLLILILMSACSTPRTRHTDPVMRVALDADSLDKSTYSRIEHALFMTEKFVVVDRNTGFRAISKEQEIQNKTKRFGANEKYALWGEMYGVGGIIVSSQSCQPHGSFFQFYYLKCIQNLVLLDATTGEIISSAEISVKTNNPQESFDWDDTIQQLIAHYPKRFINDKNLHQTIKYNDTLKNYRKEISQRPLILENDTHQQRPIGALSLTR